VAAGFEGFELTEKVNVFEGAGRPSPEVGRFGTCGVNFRAYKPQ
jgi:hypothetical protein